MAGSLSFFVRLSHKFSWDCYQWDGYPACFHETIPVNAHKNRSHYVNIMQIGMDVVSWQVLG